MAGKVFALHGGEVPEPAKSDAESTAIATLAAVWGEL
jgi:hypothetical protein